MPLLAANLDYFLRFPIAMTCCPGCCARNELDYGAAQRARQSLASWFLADIRGECEEIRGISSSRVESCQARARKVCLAPSETSVFQLQALLICSMTVVSCEIRLSFRN